MPQKTEDLSSTPLIEKITASTETREEIIHKLFIEKVRLYASIVAIAGIFCLLSAILFFHPNTELVKSSSAILNTLAGGLVGYLVKR